MGTKISILIPAKNEASFIEECLISIQKQDVDDWEAIVIDDHSTDETRSIVKHFSRQDQRVQLLINSGKGIVEALRTGYKVSRGDFITRMDADDKMRYNKLSLLSKSLCEYGHGNVAVGGVNYFSSDKVKSGFQNYAAWLNECTSRGSNFDDIFRECSIPSPNWMLHRKDLDAIGAFESDRYPEDYDLAFRMFLGGLKVIPCSSVTLDWRDYPTRTSRTSHVYEDHTFTAIKWYYFDCFFRDISRDLVLFGTGFRGKKLAKHLIEKNVSFSWVSHNKEKIGKHIYDRLINPLDQFDWRNKQVIATVANDIGRNEISTLALDNGLAINQDLIHFA